MKKFVYLLLGLLVGASFVFGFTRFVYRPTSPAKQPNLEDSMQAYIEKQKQTLGSFKTDEFDAKASQQLEQFLSDAMAIVDTAKANPSHTELQSFAADSTYALAYSREGIRIIQEELGLRPKHEGPHCDSVGSC